MLARERERLQAWPETAKCPKIFLRFEQHVPKPAMSCHFHMPPTSHCHRQNCHDSHTQTQAHTQHHLNLKGLSIPALSRTIPVTCHNSPGQIILPGNPARCSCTEKRPLFKAQTQRLVSRPAVWVTSCLLDDFAPDKKDKCSGTSAAKAIGGNPETHL